MTTAPRILWSMTAALAAAVLVVGCTGSPGAEAPTSSSAPSSMDDGEMEGIEAVWLDEGRMFAITTTGSSTCVPSVDEVSASGQTVTVALGGIDPDAVCTADLTQRASIGAFPDGIDPTKDVEFVVTYDGATDDADLDGDPDLTGVPGTQTEYTPSAGWIDDGSLVLLTWGSSMCPPVVESAEASGKAGTVTFVAEDRVCTTDMAPRATVIDFGDAEIDDDGFELTLVGANLDATVPVRG